MKSLINSIALFSLALASPTKPLEARQFAAVHPAVYSLNNVATQLESVIQEVNSYRGYGNRVATINNMFQHAQVTLNTLEKATDQIATGPSLDLLTATAFSLPIASIGLNVQRFAAALRSKKSALDAAQASPVVYKYLQLARSDSEELSKAMIAKLNPTLTWIAKPIADSMVSTLAGIEKTYRPEGEGSYLAPQQTWGQQGPQQPWGQQGQQQPWGQQGQQPSWGPAPNTAPYVGPAAPRGW